MESATEHAPETAPAPAPEIRAKIETAFSEAIQEQKDESRAKFIRIAVIAALVLLALVLFIRSLAGNAEP